MPLTPSETRTILRDIGQNPRKSLGQNFLIDGNIVAKSLELAKVKAGDAVVEVGPGLGTLTEALLAAGATVFAVELDLKLHAYLANKFAGEPRLILMQGDAVDHPVANLDPSKGPYKVVANLPYAISSPWFEQLLELPLPERAVLMLQKEAADRYLALPGTKAFGAISVFVQGAFERRPGHVVSKNCFYPAPDVSSVLLHLERRRDPILFSSQDRDRIRKLFQQRRKQLRALCRGDERLESWLEAAGIPPETRPEQVAMEAWERLGSRA